MDPHRHLGVQHYCHCDSGVAVCLDYFCHQWRNPRVRRKTLCSASVGHGAFHHQPHDRRHRIQPWVRLGCAPTAGKTAPRAGRIRVWLLAAGLADHHCTVRHGDRAKHHGTRAPHQPLHRRCSLRRYSRAFRRRAAHRLTLRHARHFSGVFHRCGGLRACPRP